MKDMKQAREKKLNMKRDKARNRRNTLNYNQSSQWDKVGHCFHENRRDGKMRKKEKKEEEEKKKFLRIRNVPGY